MRFKFKPNVSAPRGSSTTSASTAASANSASVSGVGGEAGGGREARRKRRIRRRSRGDESAGTEGESSSEIETGETGSRRRQRKNSEGSSRGGGGGQRQSAGKESSTTSTRTPSSRSSEQNDPDRAESTQNESSTVEKVQTVGNLSAQATISLPPSASQVESGLSEGPSSSGQASTNDKELQITYSSAGQMQSSADSQLHTLSSPLTTRGNAIAVTSGKMVPKIKKKVAPKVVSSRPKRTHHSSVVGTDVSTPESSQSNSEQQQEATNTVKNTSSEEKEQASQSIPQKDDSSSPHRTHSDSEKGSSTTRTPPHNTSTSDNSCDCASRAHSELSSSKAPINQTSDEAISSTLNEVLTNTHSQESEDTRLAGIVPARLGLLGGGLTTTGDGDTVVITSEESGHNEVEIRTAGSNEKNMAASESDESFIVQSCTDVARTNTELPQSTTDKTGQTSVSSSPSVDRTGQTGVSSSPSNDKTGQTNVSSSLSTDKTGQTNASCSDHTSQTSVSSSPSSSQEPRSSSKSSRRGGSVGPRSRRSESRDSSVGSEACGGEGEGETSNPGRPVSKGKRRQKRKKPSSDSTRSSSNEPGSQGSSPSPKRSRVSAAKVREAPDRSTMTMQELIYYNPTANPMSSSVEEKKRKKEEGQSVSGRGSRASSVQPPATGSRATSPANQDGGGVGGAGGGANNHDDNSGDGRIVPTLRIGVDGKIIVDETSMMMETTQQEPLEDVGEVIMDSIGRTTSASYRQRCKVTRWTKEETSRFFKALSQVGTDFTMMTLLIPKRSRRELKNKFKKEERSNPHLVSQALSKT